MQKVNNKLLNWASIIEDNTLEQAKLTSSMPFVQPHLALMPDAHLGKGATVGSVIPTVGAIMPAAVGVDIGCFSGKTLIPLVDGTEMSLEELSKRTERFLVYTVRDGIITVTHATAKCTRKDAPIITVEIDNGELIECTPDHRFMLRDGSYREAKDLKRDDSLMPFYSGIDRDGYRYVRQPNATKYPLVKAHWLVADAGLLGDVPTYPNQETIIHHKDFNPLNNSVDNLIFMGSSDHSKYHRSVKERNLHWQSEKFEDSRKKAIRRKAETPEGHTFYSERGTINIKNYMKNNPEHFKQAVAGNGQRGKQYLIAYNERKRLEKLESTNQQNNHKVVSVTDSDRRMDVYCLTVPETHNFALSAGVFVHNCGMIAVRTQFVKDDLAGKDLKELHHSIERSIPLSAGAYNRDLTSTARQRITELADMAVDRIGFYNSLTRTNWVYHLGTLGSGNHFIEITLDELDRVWLFLHSGSRGIGNAIATYHIKVAQDLMKRYYINLPDPDLAYLVEGTPEFDLYIRDLNWAQHFALLNREEMMDRVVRDFEYFIGDKVEEQERTNCHHNFTKKEHHMGRDVWLSRKGAINAAEGVPGLIPGSMGTASYIVVGKGNRAAFNSSPHGAGRVWGRKKAAAKFTLEDMDKAMDGIVYRRSKAFLDEIPAAYKDIDIVMADAADLVEIVHTLHQIVNVKGD